MYISYIHFLLPLPVDMHNPSKRCSWSQRWISASSVCSHASFHRLSPSPLSHPLQAWKSPKLKLPSVPWVGVIASMITHPDYTFVRWCLLHRCHCFRRATGRSTLSRGALRHSPWWRTCWRTTPTAARWPRCCTSTAHGPSGWKVNSQSCSPLSVATGVFTNRTLFYSNYCKKKKEKSKQTRIGPSDTIRNRKVKWHTMTKPRRICVSAAWHKGPFISCYGFIHTVKQRACLLSLNSGTFCIMNQWKIWVNNSKRNANIAWRVINFQPKQHNLETGDPALTRALACDVKNTRSCPGSWPSIDSVREARFLGQTRRSCARQKGTKACFLPARPALIF